MEEHKSPSWVGQTMCFLPELRSLFLTSKLHSAFQMPSSFHFASVSPNSNQTGTRDKEK